MLTCREWSESFGIASGESPPAVPDFSEPCPRSARQIAVRSVILQGIVCVASDVEAGPSIEWFHEQGIWGAVTPEERAFLRDASPSEQLCRKLGWHQEAEWTLLWAVGKVEALGLPDHRCDTRLMCEEIMPPLGSDIAEFVDSARLRSPGELLAEDDRTYNLWCFANSGRRHGNPLPEDLQWEVLYERRYAFEWLDGNQDWDEVTCDS